jgi:phosphohistidine phosphatase
VTPARTLILMRHAKSDYPGGVRDHDRPLSRRGRRDAAAAAAWLREQPQWQPIDEVLSSTAERTRQTVAALNFSAPVRFASEIYEGTPDDIAGQVRATREEVTTLVTVGHAPGIPGLVMELTAEDSDAALTDAVSARFPTAAMAVLQWNGSWSELEYGMAKLTGFFVPRA